MPTGARILAIDDEPHAIQLYKKALKEEGHDIVGALSCEEGLDAARQGGFEAVLLDFNLPDGDGIALISELRAICGAIPIIMVTSHGSTARAVKAIRQGAHDFIEKPFGIEALRVSVFNALEFGRLSRREAFHRERAFHDRYIAYDPEAFDGFPEPVAKVLGRAAPTHTTILINGETGAGKEHTAALIHQASGRDGAFVAVNCGAIPAQLAESELFGHEKGAFTGADQTRPGKFEVADGGTLFLDEIGELPLDLQPKLLRSLESGEITRVGAKSPIRVDARILAATNRDLEKEVAEGRFREDLFFRLNVLRIAVPPLRERRDIILPLADQFLRRAIKDVGRSFDGFAADAIELFETYAFPGNVRELANAIERAVLLEDSDQIQAASLGLGARTRRGDTAVDSSLPYRDAKEAFERQYFEGLMKRTQGNISEAARRTGLHRNNLRTHLVRLGLLDSGE